MLRAVRYVEIAVEVDAAAGERLAAELVEAGLAVEQRDATTLLKPPPGRALVVVWVEPARAESTRAQIEDALREQAIVAELRLAERDEDEWREVWKQFFLPRSVGRIRSIRRRCTGTTRTTPTRAADRAGRCAAATGS